MRTPRAVALEALNRIEDGAYANLVLPGLLGRSTLDERDRRFVTELVYGSTRMRRAVDHLVARHLDRRLEELDAAVRNALRLGAYQLAFAATPAHAAVGETVAEVPRRARGLVNAVLRRVAENLPPDYPEVAVELSYPDWIVELLTSELGAEDGLAALRRMNEPPAVTERPDGYVQDPASQEVAAYVGGAPGETIADVCAAPGGKATFIAERGPALVVAGDVQEARAQLTAANVDRLRLWGSVAVVVADGRRPAHRDGVFDRVLVDAPCSGLGVLRRRPDARWRIQPEDVPALAALQRELLDRAAALARPGGRLVYSVCTLARAETLEIDEWLAEAHPELSATPAPHEPWRPLGRGARLLPHDADTDGMYVLGLRRDGPAAGQD